MIKKAAFFKNMHYSYTVLGNKSTDLEPLSAVNTCILVQFVSGASIFVTGNTHLQQHLTDIVHNSNLIEVLLMLEAESYL